MTASVTVLTLVGKPGSWPPEVGTIMSTADYSGTFVIESVAHDAHGGWQATAWPSRMWRQFHH